MPDACVKLDYTLACADAVGPHGLAPSDFDSDALARIYDQARRVAPQWGFTQLPARLDSADALVGLGDTLAKECDDFVVIGIGGSALGNITLHASLNPPSYNLASREARGDRPRIHVPDNVDPVLIASLLDTLVPERTCVNVIAKSGSTAETLANFLVVRALLEQGVGAGWTDHVVFTTDPEKGALRALGRELGIRMLEVPPNVGGRFSVLSPVGLLSASVEGIEVKALLQGAQAMLERCQCADWRANPAFFNAVLHYLFDVRKGVRMNVMMPYAQSLREIADWFRQLWAESLGKCVDRSGQPIECGLTPIKALGATDQHSQVQLYVEGPPDKFTTFLHVDQFPVTTTITPAFKDEAAFAYLGGRTLNELLHAEEKATRAALAKAGRPSVTISLPAVNAYYLGQLLFMFELQTAYAGELYNIDAFDQPGVEQGKIFTYALMGRDGYADARRELEGMQLSNPQCVIA